jgi:hypothetical protein
MKNKDRGIKGWVLKSFVEPLLKGFTTAPINLGYLPNSNGAII